MENLTITRDQLIEDIDRIDPKDYPKAFTWLHKFRPVKPASKKSLEALEKLFSIEGCLKNENITSVELQKRVADDWNQSYEIN